MGRHNDRSQSHRVGFCGPHGRCASVHGHASASMGVYLPNNVCSSPCYAERRDQVIFAYECPGQTSGNRFQHSIAVRVAEIVVDVLEAIDIDHGQTDSRFCRANVSLTFPIISAITRLISGKWPPSTASSIEPGRLVSNCFVLSPC